MRVGEETQRQQAQQRREIAGARWSFGAMIALSWALLATVLLGGCVTQSLHPISSDETLVLEPALLGDWVDSSSPGDRVMTFSLCDDTS